MRFYFYFTTFIFDISVIWKITYSFWFTIIILLLKNAPNILVFLSLIVSISFFWFKKISYTFNYVFFRFLTSPMFFISSGISWTKQPYQSCHMFFIGVLFIVSYFVANLSISLIDMIIGLKLFSYSKVPFFNCFCFCIFHVSNDPFICITKKKSY